MPFTLNSLSGMSIISLSEGGLTFKIMDPKLIVLKIVKSNDKLNFLAQFSVSVQCTDGRRALSWSQSPGTIIILVLCCTLQLRPRDCSL